MPLSAAPYAVKKFADIKGRRMAYIDVGDGPAIVFQHGNPTSSYLWRNIMPHCEGLGRLVACDLIGMGDSDKLAALGPRPLHLRRAARLPVRAVGQAGARRQHRSRPPRLGLGAGLRMGAPQSPIASPASPTWRRSSRRSPGPTGRRTRAAPSRASAPTAGEDMILDKNMFVERVLPGSILRKLADEEMAEYRRPFASPGEDRRPTLTWPRQIPIEGEPADVVAVVEDYSRWLAASDVPKLFINADPGSILVGRQREVCRAWPNQTEVTVKGLHFIQEDSPDEIGHAVAEFVRQVREPA